MKPPAPSKATLAPSSYSRPISACAHQLQKSESGSGSTPRPAPKRAMGFQKFSIAIAAMGAKERSFLPQPKYSTSRIHTSHTLQQTRSSDSTNQANYKMHASRRLTTSLCAVAQTHRCRPRSNHVDVVEDAEQPCGASLPMSAIHMPSNSKCGGAAEGSKLTQSKEPTPARKRPSTDPTKVRSNESTVTSTNPTKVPAKP